MMAGKIISSKWMGCLIACALILAFSFTSCVSAPPTALPTFLPANRKSSVRTIGVVSAGAPELAMGAYKKDERSQVASKIGLAGVDAGLFALPLGIIVGAIDAAAIHMPEKRAKEIEAAVLPALSEFPFQQRLVELIAAAGNRNTEYDFQELRSGDTPVDAILEVGVLSLGLRKLEKALCLVAVVQARLLEKDMGTPIVSRSLGHGWRVFGKKKPKLGDRALAREEIDGHLRVLSEDIVDMLFLLDDFSEQFPAGGYGELSLQPKNPKSKRKSVTVDSLQPRLEWVPFPSKKDKSLDTKAVLKELGPVSYDLRIWKVFEEEYHPVELIYERRDLADPQHVVEQPLEPGISYFWAVRARFEHEGQPTVTRWTLYPAALMASLADLTDFPLGNDPLSMFAGQYRFSTPGSTDIN